MEVLNKFKIEKDEYNNIIVESKVSGNKTTVEPSLSGRPRDVLLWTVLNDLFEEGHLSNSI